MKDEILYLNPAKVKVSKDAPRYRSEMGDVQKMATSIREHGQLSPIIITEDHTLVAGGRRLAACLLLQTLEDDPITVTAMITGKQSAKQLRGIEIEENVQRKAFTPAEKELAIADYHNLKMDEAGEDSGYGTSKGEEKKWNMKKTAEALSISIGSVSAALQTAPVIRENTELLQCKSQQGLRKQAKKVTRKQQASENVAKKAEALEVKKALFSVVKTDADVFMKTFAPDSVDIIITDPPYMMNIHEKRQVKDEQYSDSAQEYLLGGFTSDCTRILKPSGCLYMFIATEYFPVFKIKLEEAGMIVYWKEIIWIKSVSGQTNNPDKWPGDCYEKILFARMPEHLLEAEGYANWVRCDRAVNPTHQAEKPLALIKNLLMRSVMLGQTLVDPFVGSGAIIEAAVKQKLTAHGCDNQQWCVDLANERLLKYL